MDAATGPAAVPGAPDADDAKPARHPVQHLAHRLADRVQGATATGAGLRLEVEAYLLALQVLGQARPVRSPPESGLIVSRHLRQQFLGPADVSAQILQPQLQLTVIQSLGPPAELLALQLLHDEPQALDLGLCLGERPAFADPFRRQLPD